MENRAGRFRAPLPPRMSDPFDGILPVDKPAGPTSHDIVDAIRRKFDIKKVGHGGTLDPQATGVLVILTGRGTKLSNRFMSSDKVYEGTICLGVATDSQDAQGKVISTGDYSAITREQLEAETRKLTGDIMQIPPMVSAVKIDGIPLYKRARRGESIEREPRLVHIYEFSIKEFELPEATFIVRCTKGTYVRTLCADIGEVLGCGAHLKALRRTETGSVSIKDSLPFDEIMNMSRADLMQKIIPIHKFALKTDT